MLKEKQVYDMGTTGHSIDTFNAAGEFFSVMGCYNSFLQLNIGT